MISQEVINQYTNAKTTFAETKAVWIAKQNAVIKLEQDHKLKSVRRNQLIEMLKTAHHNVRIGFVSADDVRAQQAELEEINTGWAALCNELMLTQGDLEQFSRNKWRKAKEHLKAPMESIAAAQLQALLNSPITDESLLQLVTVMSFNLGNRNLGKAGNDTCSPNFYTKFGELLLNKLLKTEQNPNGYLPSFEVAKGAIDTAAMVV